MWRREQQGADAHDGKHEKHRREQPQGSTRIKLARSAMPLANAASSSKSVVMRKPLSTKKMSTPRSPFGGRDGAVRVDEHHHGHSYRTDPIPTDADNPDAVPTPVPRSRVTTNATEQHHSELNAAHNARSGGMLRASCGVRCRERGGTRHRTAPTTTARVRAVDRVLPRSCGAGVPPWTQPRARVWHLNAGSPKNRNARRCHTIYVRSKLASR